VINAPLNDTLLIQCAVMHLYQKNQNGIFSG